MDSFLLITSRMTSEGGSIEYIETVKWIAFC